MAQIEIRTERHKLVCCIQMSVVTRLHSKGSRFTPVLRDIFLSKIDQALEVVVLHSLAVKVSCYVDDYLVVFDTNAHDPKSGDLLNIFEQNGLCLKFTTENMKDVCLQFLYLKLKFMLDHVCWMYAARSVKPLLKYSSGNTKLVRNALAFSCFHSAVMKSCPHLMEPSFTSQVQQLREADFPQETLSLVCQKLVHNIKNGGPTEHTSTEQECKKIAMLPYIHDFTHGLKKDASHYSVQVLISAHNKPGRLCTKVDCHVKWEQIVSTSGCSVKHRHCYVPCRTSIIYPTPLHCKCVYMGQTGRYLNVRLRGHYDPLDGATSS